MMFAVFHIIFVGFIYVRSVRMYTKILTGHVISIPSIRTIICLVVALASLASFSSALLGLNHDVTPRVMHYLV